MNSASAPPVAVVFLNHSFPIPSQHFVQTGANQWVLDVVTAVTPNYPELKDICLFLTQPNAMDPALGVGLYVKMGNSDWCYRGAVHVAQPSEAMPISWPADDGVFVPPAPGVAQIGISIEPAAELAQKEGSKLASRQEFAKKVAENLFHFMQSFSVAAAGDNIVVPHDILNRWFLKFSDRFKRDPDFLTRT